MISWLKQLDGLLRGKSTEPELLVRGAAELAVRGLVVLGVVLGAVYGCFMGWYAVATRETPSAMQLVASMVKLPLLFLLTLVVTFPSLYVFSALTGCRLGFLAVLRLLVAAITVNLAVAASMAPILGFFTLSTESYAFMVLLNVVLLGVSGAVALGFLLRVLQKLADAMAPPFPPARPTIKPAGNAGMSDAPGPAATPWSGGSASSEKSGNGVFYIWVMIYSLVGAQMGWLLRPFIGHPKMPFEWFRQRQGNFFEAVWGHLRQLLEGGM